MKTGDAILMKDVQLPEGCTAITHPDDMLVSILHPRAVAEPAETEAAAPAVPTETPAAPAQ